MRVLVLGAGVVGVATAYYLARHGHEVTVVDRQPGVALETSFANGGQVSASHAEPWATPATLRRVFKWLGRADAPLLFRFRFDPQLWGWGLRFLANCTAFRTRINTERALRIALHSRACLKELRREIGLEYDHGTRGILHFYRDPKEFGHAVEQAGVMTDLGCRRRPIDPAACVDMEPALAAVQGDLAGGIYSPDDESGDAYLFTQSLEKHCRGMGVDFRFGTTIRAVRTDKGLVTGIETDGGVMTADRYVLALGSYSPLLLRPLGIRLPIYPAKGYSVTFPVCDPAKAPTVSLTDDEHKLVFSRLGERLRVAGTAETAGYDTTLNEHRARVILKRTLEIFPGCGKESDAEFWAGLRPKTPDSVPVIGPTPFPNLFLNTGHGTLGWTMSCGSGRVVADLVSGSDPEISLDGLGMDRFT